MKFTCYDCKQEIAFDERYVSKNGKKIKLDPLTMKPHVCPASNYKQDTQPWKMKQTYPDTAREPEQREIPTDENDEAFDQKISTKPTQGYWDRHNGEIKQSHQENITAWNAQTNEIKRSNDLKEVELGIMSKEEYISKYKNYYDTTKVTMDRLEQAAKDQNKEPSWQ